MADASGPDLSACLWFGRRSSHTISYWSSSGIRDDAARERQNVVVTPTLTAREDPGEMFVLLFALT